MVREDSFSADQKKQSNRNRMDLLVLFCWLVLDFLFSFKAFEIFQASVKKSLCPAGLILLFGIPRDVNHVAKKWYGLQGMKKGWKPWEIRRRNADRGRIALDMEE